MFNFYYKSLIIETLFQISMEQSKKILIGILLLLVVVIITILFIFLTPLSYDRVLTYSEQKITRTINKTMNYKLSIIGNYEKKFIDEEGTAVYTKEERIVNWAHDLTQIDDSIYDLTPEELIDLMQEEMNRTGYLVNDEYPNQPCYLLKSEIMHDLDRTLIEMPQEIVIFACFNSVNGYPDYYTIGAKGQGTLTVNYQLIK